MGKTGTTHHKVKKKKDVGRDRTRTVSDGGGRVRWVEIC